MTVTDIIYHGGCNDGFTSAWLLKGVYPDAVLHAGRYGVDPPKMSCSDAHVVIADFSYKRQPMHVLAYGVASVTVLDHHASAERELVDLPDNVTTVFDTKRCGSRIVYDWLLENGHGNDYFGNDFFMADSEPLVNYIQDFDLWTKELPGIEEVGAYIGSLDMNHEVWTQLADDMFEDLNSVVTAGVAILRSREKIMSTHLQTAREISIAGYTVKAVSVPYSFGSSMAELMCTGDNDEYPFGAYYIHHPWGTQWGLRSREFFDVSEVAELFGGGGHKNAAGFEMKGDWGFENVANGEMPTTLAEYDPDAPFTPGSSTSKEAAFAIMPVAGTLRAVILHEILDGPKTDDEIETKFNMHHGTSTARRGELVKGGWVTDSGFTRLTRSGRNATVWRATDKAKTECSSHVL